MSTRIPDVPGVPNAIDAGIKRVIVNLREHVREMRGFQGAAAGRAMLAGDVATIITDVVPGLIPPAAPPYEPDLTPPPTPSGVTVGAGIDFISIQTAAPTFTAGHGYGRTIVYGAKYPGTGALPTFSAAVVVHEFIGQVGSFPTDPATEWHIWVKWRTVDGVESTAPEGGTNGHTVTTGQDVSLLLLALSGEITESQLYTALGDRIDLIDGPDTLSGSVAYRVLAEATARGAAISSEATTRASADSAISSTVTALAATVSSNTAAISSEATTRATADSAMASDITTLYASAGTNSAAISTEATARAALDGSVHALYTVRAQVTEGGRTVVGGFGLSATSTIAGGTEIEFGVRADRFYIGAASGTTGVGDVLPFIVQTTDVVVNGVTIPKGVYMDAAYIVNLTAMVARLGALWVTNAMIADLSASKITAGSIAVGDYIQSSNYVAGSAGWRVHGNGFGEFSNVTIRGATYTGTIYAGAGTIGGITINATNMRSTGYVPDTSGFSIDNSSGSIEVNNLRVRGTLDIKSGTSGARVEQTASYIKVFDASNVKRIQIGDLSA